MIKTFLLCVYFLMIVHEAEAKRTIIYNTPGCFAKIVINWRGKVKYSYVNNTGSNCPTVLQILAMHGYRRRLTTTNSEEPREESSSLFRAISHDIFLTLKGINATGENNFEDIGFGYQIYDDQDRVPAFILRRSGEQYVISMLNEDTINEERKSMIQSKEDAQLLEEIEIGLANALTEARP